MSGIIYTNDDRYDATIMTAVLKHWPAVFEISDPRNVAMQDEQRYRVAFVKAVIAHESQFNPRAFNGTGGDAKRGGSYGLMQLSLMTARAVGFAGNPDELLTPEVNIDYGVGYLSDCVREVAAHSAIGDTLACAASDYNGGYRPSEGYGARRVSDRQFANQAYVDAVLANFAKYSAPIIAQTVKRATPPFTPRLVMGTPSSTPPSKTGLLTSIAGAAASVFGFLDSQAVLSVLPTKVGTIVAALGGLLTVFGIHLHINNSTQS